MERLIDILEACFPTVDFKNAQGIISNKLIDSIDLVSIISDIEEEFDISIDLEEIGAENFDSVESIWEMVQKISC